MKMSSHEKRPYYARFGFRVTVVAALLVVLVSGVLGSISYIGMRQYVVDNIQQNLLNQGNRMAASFSERLSGIEASLRSITSNTMVANSLLDTMGRNTYLVPFLEGFNKLGDIPLTVFITNHRGKILVGDLTHAKLETKKIADIIESGKGATFMQAAQDDLLVQFVQPIFTLIQALQKGPWYSSFICLPS